jgi:hypothetical protein
MSDFDMDQRLSWRSGGSAIAWTILSSERDSRRAAFRH